MPRVKRSALTLPDLVVLSLLAEGPNHGYAIVAELERRQVEDWAGISRPQVYYSLAKLQRAGFVRTVDDAAPATGPERQRVAITATGRRAAAAALARPDWAEHRSRPPFLTWLALSWLLDPDEARAVVAARRRFLQEELARERAALAAIKLEVGPESYAALMVGLTIRQFRLELGWLDDVDRLLFPAG